MMKTQFTKKQTEEQMHKKNVKKSPAITEIETKKTTTQFKYK